MMHFRKLGAIAGAAALFLGSGCVDLDVTNPNNPDIDRALASPEDVQALAASTMNSWYLTSTNLHPYFAMQVTADASSANFGNFGMRFNNLEPRAPYENNSAGGDRDVAREPWDFNYGTLGASNDAIRAFTAGGIKLATQEETDAYHALALWTRAASMMNLALIFDSSFVVLDTTNTAEKIPLSDYKTMSAEAVKAWDQTIAATAGKSTAYPAAVIPSTPALTMTVLNRLANTLAAATLAYTPRTAAEAASAPWAQVLAYAEKGITSDFLVKGDLNDWWSYINYYGNEPSWVRVDLRLINRMDPTLSSKYTGAAADLAESTNPAADARIHTDFTNHGNVIGDPGRGIYMQTPWSHSRYFHHARFSPTRGQTAVPYILKAENDLLIAEALVRTNGDLARAAELINNTRVGRGELEPVTAASGTAALLEAIDYERDVELLNTNGFALFHARHFDRLQEGTWRHLPIPAKELETLGLPVYTYGGVGKPDMLIVPTASGDLNIRQPVRMPRIQTHSIFR